MGVHLRKKDCKDGRQSLYLDYYPPIPKGDGTFTRREFLNRKIFKKPKNLEEKNFNKETLHFADSVRLKREKGILNEEHGIFDKLHKKRDFLKYFKDLTNKRQDEKGNFGNWSSALKYLSAFTGNSCKMGDIDENFCNKFKEYLLCAYRLNTINKLRLSTNSAHSYFNKFYCAVKQAFEDRYINHNPLKHITGIKTLETKREFLTLEELKKLLTTECEIPQLKNAAILSAYSGLRWSDLNSLKWGDIQYTEESYFIHIRQQKTKTIALIPISESGIKILGDPGLTEERIFKGLKYSDSNNDKLKKWILDAGITKKITLHNFRHTYATLLLNNGASLLTVSGLLGHKNLKTTQIYAKILDETKISASKLIDFSS